jgi:hypothetical protein
MVGVPLIIFYELSLFILPSQRLPASTGEKSHLTLLQSHGGHKGDIQY